MSFLIDTKEATTKVWLTHDFLKTRAHRNHQHSPDWGEADHNNLEPGMQSVRTRTRQKDMKTLVGITELSSFLPSERATVITNLGTTTIRRCRIFLDLRFPWGILTSQKTSGSGLCGDLCLWTFVSPREGFSFDLV